MKILVLGHSDIYSTYGAATSIRNHFKCFSSEDDIFFSHLYRRNLRQTTGGLDIVTLPYLCEVKSVWLPINTRVFKHTYPGFLKNLYGVVLPNIMAKLFNRNLIFHIEKCGADLIHLNSIVLWPIVSLLKENDKLKDVKIVMHVRELFDERRGGVAVCALENVDGFVFIDEAVKGRLFSCLPVLKKKYHRVIQNPFKSNYVIDPEISDLLPADRSFCNFAVAGVVGEDKGVEFICKTFYLYAPPESKLFVIGKKNKLSSILEKKYGSEKIVFTGEIKDLEGRGAFSCIDCVIRGETTFCTGRSTYEALYAGGAVIIPGEFSNLESDEQLLRFKENVYLYKSRSESSLREAMINVWSRIRAEKISSKSSRNFSNFDEYKSKIMEFYDFVKKN